MKKSSSPRCGRSELPAPGLQQNRIAELRAIAGGYIHPEYLAILQNVGRWSEQEYLQWKKQWPAALEHRAQELKAAEARAKAYEADAPARAKWEAALALEVEDGEAGKLYYRVTLLDGRFEWRISSHLARIRENLLQIRKIENQETYAAFWALWLAGARVRRFEETGMDSEYILDPDYISDDPVTNEEGKAAVVGFLMPLAKRLSRPPAPSAEGTQSGLGNSEEAGRLRYPKSEEEARALKDAALIWVGEAIDCMFPEWLQAEGKWGRMAAELIDMAWDFCKNENRLPYRAELEEFARKAFPERWNFGSTDWSKFRKATGLDALRKSPVR